MRIFRAVLMGAAALAARAAQANCAMPAEYLITEDPAGTVRVRLQNGAGRTCPDNGLLRQGPTPVTVVEITSCDGADFVDECVPAGTYQCGLATPYECQPASCGTFFFGSVAVVGAAPECVSTVPAPVAADGVPWTGHGSTICQYSGPDGAGCGVAPAGTVLRSNLALLLVGVALWRWRWRGGPRPRP